MKLYYSPGACSLATRISLHEAGIPIDGERVDLKAKVTERGADYLAVNPAGSVPMIVLDDDQVVTENVAILALIAEHEPKLDNAGPLGRTRLLEMLSFLSTELHIAFNFSTLTLGPNSRLGLAVQVERAGTSGGGLQFMYDEPSFDSRLEVNTPSTLPF